MKDAIYKLYNKEYNKGSSDNTLNANIEEEIKVDIIRAFL